MSEHTDDFVVRLGNIALRYVKDEYGSYPPLSDEDEATDLEAEMWLIGSCLISSEVYLAVSGTVRPEDFSEGGLLYAEVWRSMQRLSRRGEPTSFEFVIRDMKASCPHWGQLSFTASSILDCAAAVPTAVHAPFYARIVAECSARRQAIRESKNLLSSALNPNVRIEDVVAKMSRAAGRITLATGTSDIVAPMDRATRAYDSIVERQVDGDTTALPFGLRDLDAVLSGGVRPGQLILLGGRPGMGKTALLRDAARSFAQFGAVLFASNEMTIEQTNDRDLSALANVSLPTVTRGRYGDDTLGRLVNAVGKIGETQIYEYPDGSMTTDKLRAVVEEFRQRQKLVAVVVDYLQRFADGGNRGDNERVGTIARHLKAMAYDLNVPVIAGSQLTRNSDRDSAKDYRPTLTDLRDSGALEQEADIVLLLYRASYYWPTEEEWKKSAAGRSEPWPANKAEIIVAKQRQGLSNARVEVAWLPQITSYRDLERRN